jgi:hypothetical protein
MIEVAGRPFWPFESKRAASDGNFDGNSENRNAKNGYTKPFSRQDSTPISAPDTCCSSTSEEGQKPIKGSGLFYRPMTSSRGTLHLGYKQKAPSHNSGLFVIKSTSPNGSIPFRLAIALGR